jgi:hypothetical protein
MKCGPEAQTQRLPVMTRKAQHNQLARALARWDNEGGAIIGEGDDGRDALNRDEQEILQCLGRAVVAQWNKLPTAVQRALFEHPVSNADPRECLDLREHIALFLHHHRLWSDRMVRRQKGRSL